MSFGVQAALVLVTLRNVEEHRNLDIYMPVYIHHFLVSYLFEYL